MKILYLCLDLGIPVLGRKGASVHVRSLVAALRRAGHSVVLVAPVLNKSPWEEPAKLEASLVHLPPGPDTVAAVLALKAFNETLGVANSLPGELRYVLYNQGLSVELRRRFDSAPPDFIYERASLYGTAGASLARDLDRPRLVELNAPLTLEHATYHGSTGLGGLAAQVERWGLLQADAVLTVSGPLRDHVIALRVDPDRVHVLPNGVDPALFHPGPPDPTLRRRWGLGDGPVLGFVGGLRPWTGVGTLPAALNRLVQRYRDLRLVIAGDGPLRGELERAVRERGLMRRVIFTGPLPHEQVPDLIRLFDVALAPYSQPEHAWYISPMKLFEYMACGVAIIAAGLGQIAEVVRDGETGLLYPHGQVDALVAACERLLADPALRRSLGQAAAKEVHDRYTWDENAERVAELARSLIVARRVAG
jgi:glycosyltransferase involved in cell wall biosynthesis